MKLRTLSALGGLIVAAIYAATPHPIWAIVVILSALSVYNLATALRDRKA